MEQAFGADFSGVKVHTDGQSDQLNQSIQARAFTTGQDIFFRQGQYEPGSKGGQELLAHELTHVVQQNGGSGKNDGVQTQAIQRIAMAAAPAIVFGPVGLAVAVTITGVTVIIWLNNGGWEEIGRITDAIGKGIEGILQELGDILSRAGNAAVEQFGKIEDYIREHIFPMAAPGNEADTGILAEAYELIHSGIARDMCHALAILMEEAKAAADTLRIRRIKKTQKVKKCRHSRHDD
jgi:hypothetical protein